MTTESKSPKFSTEVRGRAVRMVFEHRTEHASQWAAIVSIAAKIGCTAQTLSNWVRQAERDQGKRPGTTTASPPTAMRARCGAQTPSAPPAHAPRQKTLGILIRLSWLQSLKSWSLRQTRGGSAFRGGGPLRSILRYSHSGISNPCPPAQDSFTY